MKIHVNELRDEVINGEDLEQLKRAVSAHLDTIDENLQSFVQTESDRQRAARRTIDTMVEKLQDLESEAEELRENLEEQQAKVVIDPLTGILNRTGYLASINKEFSRWRRYSGDLSLAMVDLDLFKQINDRYGHAAGDKVLATVAAQLKSQIRECDYLCRYGGEEFVLVLPETDSNAGFAMLDKLRAYIESCNFHYKETPVPVTLSCGIAQFHRGDKIEEVFDRADRAMYLAKQAGRNRCAQESLETAELA
jgi:diguanylate cyclase